MKDTVRNLAVDWQDWASNEKMSWDEVAQWTTVISDMAKLADPSGELIEELKENGIL